MNKGQQVTLAIIIPFIGIILGYGATTFFKVENKMFTTLGWGEQFTTIRWDDFEKTWWIWLIVVIIIGISEYILFKKSLNK